MVLIQPFRAIRYAPERVDLAAVLAPPADDIDPAAARELYAREPRNAVRVVKNLPEADDAPGGPDRRAAFFLADWRRAGVLLQDEAPAFYLLRQTFPGAGGAPVVRQGFFAAVELGADPAAVRAHERVDEARVEGLAERLSALGAQVDPLLLLHPDPEERVSRAFEVELEREADLRFTLAGGLHEVWVIDDETTTARVSQLLVDAPLYIADGHHRHRAARAFWQDRALAPGRFVLAFLCPAGGEGAQISSSHRVVTGLWDFDADAFLEAAERTFTCHALVDDSDLDEMLLDLLEDRVAFGVEIPGRGRFVFELSPAVSRAELPLAEDDAFADATVLERVVLEGVLGLEGAALKERVLRVNGPNGGLSLPRPLEEGEIGFLLRPLPLARLFQLADEGRLLPPKSTRFSGAQGDLGLKLPSGLVFADLHSALRARDG